MAPCTTGPAAAVGGGDELLWLHRNRALAGAGMLVWMAGSPKAMSMRAPGAPDFRSMEHAGVGNDLQLCDPQWFLESRRKE